MWRTVSKAVAGAIGAAGSALGAAAIDGSVETAEWWAVLGAAMVGYAAVYAAPRNSDPEEDGSS